MLHLFINSVVYLASNFIFYPTKDNVSNVCLQELQRDSNNLDVEWYCFTAEPMPLGHSDTSSGPSGMSQDSTSKYQNLIRRDTDNMYVCCIYSSV